MNRHYKIAFLTYASIYFCSVITAIWFILRYTIYLFTSLDSFTWGNAKGAIIVIIIVLIRTIVVFTLKFKRAGREKDDKQTNHPSSRKIKKAYETEAGTIQILKGLSTKFYSGEIVSIIGPSGSGKSTLLGILGSLDTPTEGRIIIEQQDITSMSEEKLADFRAKRLVLFFNRII